MPNIILVSQTLITNSVTISCCPVMTCSRVMTSYYFHLFSLLKFSIDVGQSTFWYEDTFPHWNQVWNFSEIQMHRYQPHLGSSPFPHSLALGHVLDLNILLLFFSTWHTYRFAPYTTDKLSPIYISEICIESSWSVGAVVSVLSMFISVSSVGSVVMLAILGSSWFLLISSLIVMSSSSIYFCKTIFDLFHPSQFGVNLGAV